MPIRLAIILSHPVQYYSPWFRWIRDNSDIQLRVFYLWDAGIKPVRDPQFNTTFAWDVDLQSGYEHEFVPNTARKPGSGHFNGLRNPSLIARVRAWKPDVVLLFGYKYHTHLRFLLWARGRGLPVIFRGDSHLLGRGRLPWFKRLSLSFLYRQFSAFACVGLANRAYFRSFGLPEPRLFSVPHCVNDAHFEPTDAVRKEAQRLHSQLGITPGTRVILFAGKLTSAKQPCELLSAYLQLQPAKTSLIYVGEGEELASLKTLAAQAPFGSVHFLPFANQSEMPARYLLADLFVLPSRGHYETWGLAVNEAMHMGVPCLVSDRVGCQRDLVTDGVTGWVFPAEQQGALAAALHRALRDIENRPEYFRAQVAERISHYTYATATAGLEQAVTSLFPAA